MLMMRVGARDADCSYLRLVDNRQQWRELDIVDMRPIPVANQLPLHNLSLCERLWYSESELMLMREMKNER